MRCRGENYFCFVLLSFLDFDDHSSLFLHVTDAYNCKQDNEPCQNGGLCIESEPSFTCTCTQQHYGSLCDQGW